MLQSSLFYVFYDSPQNYEFLLKGKNFLKIIKERKWGRFIAIILALSENVFFKEKT